MTEQPANPGNEGRPRPDDVSTVHDSQALTRGEQQDPLIGTAVGQYTIKRVIGSGGMGTVYEALQQSPRRTVALKMMKQGISSRNALRRFEYEAQTLGRLRHHNIAQIYEAGTHDDGTGARPFFAMEYLAGAKPLTTYARDKKLGTRERLELFSKVCDAVQHGHQKGIIHRDLKPPNILVTSSGVPKIIDFGVARSTDSDMAVTTLQTDVGALIGTLQYMSPEQCAADPNDIDTRSDVYALGVVLYELLCESLPYDVTRVAIAEAARIVQQEEPTKPSTVDKRLRGDVETIALKALEKDRDRRYQSATALEDDINRYLAGEAITAKAPSAIDYLRRFARKHKAAAISIAAIFVVLVGAMIAISIFAVRARQAEEELQVELETTKQLAAKVEGVVEQVKDASRKSAELVVQLGLKNAELESGNEELRKSREILVSMGKALSEEVKRAEAEAAEAEMQRDLADQQTQLAKQAREEADAKALEAIEARDEAIRQAYLGNLAAASGAIDRKEVISGHRRLAAARAAIGNPPTEDMPFEWRHLAAANDDAALRITTDTMTQASLFDDQARRVAVDIRQSQVLAFNLDGTRLLSFNRRRHDKNNDYQVIDVQTGALLDSGQLNADVAAEFNLHDTFVAVEGDSSMLGLGEYAGTTVIDLVSGETVSTLEDSEKFLYDYRFSQNGSVVASRGSTDSYQLTQCWLVETGQALPPITLPYTEEFALSPDGSLLAVGFIDMESRTSLIQLTDSTTGEMVLTLGKDQSMKIEQIQDICFSPDGNSLAVFFGDGQTRLYDLETGQIIADMAGTFREVFTGSLKFSPDGQSLAIFTNDNLIRVWDVRTGEIIDTFRGHRDRIEAMAISPDGTKLASCDWSDTIRIWHMENLAGTESETSIIQVQGEASLIELDSHGTLLATLSSGLVNIWDLQADELLATLPHGYATDLAFHPDGTRLFTTTLEGNVISWDLLTGTKTIVVEGDGAELAVHAHLAISPDGNLLATGGIRSPMRIVNLETGEPQCAVPLLSQLGITTFEFSPDSGTLATSSATINGVQRWDVQTCDSLDQHWSMHIRSFCFNADGSKLFVGTSEGDINIIELAEKTIVGTMHGHESDINVIAITPDGTRVATGSDDRTIRIWDPNNLDEVLTLTGHGSPIRSLQFSTDGSMLISCEEDGTMFVWDTRTRGARVSQRIAAREQAEEMDRMVQRWKTEAAGNTSFIEDRFHQEALEMTPRDQARLRGLMLRALQPKTALPGDILKVLELFRNSE